MNYFALEQITNNRIKERHIEACRARMMRRLTSADPGVLERVVWKAGKLLVGIGNSLLASAKVSHETQAVSCEEC